MSDPKPFYISLLNPGYVLTYQESGKPSGVVMSHADERGDEDKWTIEHDDESNTVAFKSVASCKYLAGTPKQEGTVGTSDEKQWWNLEHDGDTVRAPGAYRLSMASAPEFSLRAWNSSSFKPGRPGWRVCMFRWPVRDSLDTNWELVLIDPSRSTTKTTKRGISPKPMVLQVS
jgi:hypothetical protein